MDIFLNPSNGFKNLATKFSKSNSIVLNILVIKLVIMYEFVCLFWFVSTIEGMAYSMANTKIMENDDWFET